MITNVTEYLLCAYESRLHKMQNSLTFAQKVGKLEEGIIPRLDFAATISSQLLAQSARIIRIFVKNIICKSDF